MPALMLLVQSGRLWGIARDASIHARLGPSARGGPASAMLTAFANREMTKKDA